MFGEKKIIFRFTLTSLNQNLYIYKLKGNVIPIYFKKNPAKKHIYIYMYACKFISWILYRNNIFKGGGKIISMSKKTTHIACMATEIYLYTCLPI